MYVLYIFLICNRFCTLIQRSYLYCHEDQNQFPNLSRGIKEHINWIYSATLEVTSNEIYFLFVVWIKEECLPFHMQMYFFSPGTEFTGSKSMESTTFLLRRVILPMEFTTFFQSGSFCMVFSRWQSVLTEHVSLTASNQTAPTAAFAAFCISEGFVCW